jgi:Fe2+ or Zn2+ uptake regulation protein
MTKGEKGKDGFQKVYSDEDFIKVLDETDVSTKIVQERLKKLNKKYKNIHYDTVKKTLIRLAETGNVEKVEKEGLKMYFWKK